MQTPQTIGRAAAQQWLGAMTCGAISVALLAWLARSLGPTEFAIYGATLNSALIALVAIEGGWSLLMYRELSRSSVVPGAHRLPSAAFAYALLAFWPSWLVMIIFTSSITLAFSAAACMFAVALMNQRSARLRAESKFAGEALWQLVGRASSALVIVTTLVWWVDSPVRGEARTIAVFAAWAAGLALCLVVTLPRWWRAPSWEALTALYPMAASVLVVELSIAVIAKGDLVVLYAAREWLGDASNALDVTDALAGYAASVRLMEAVLLGVAPLGNVVIAYMRSAATNQATGSYRALLVAALCFWLVGCVLCAIGWCCNEQIVTVVFGAAFASGASWLRWASLSLPWMMANLLLLQAALALLPLRSVASVALVVATGFVLSLILMTHFFSMIGVALVAALSQAALTLLLIRALLRQCSFGAVAA